MTPETEYPSHRAADVLLSDGSTVHLRPIRPTDAPAVVAFHGQLSERTRQLRYFAAYPRIPERDLARFTTVDHVDREAFVVELGDVVLAIGRYDRIGANDAEVAFVVADAFQGKGIGSVLLEHLAAAAAENGLRRFVAEVLPHNGAMMRIFTDAGYVATRDFEEGVVHLEFDIAPTTRSIEVRRDRERRAEARSITRLLAPSSVAVVGVGPAADTVEANLRSSFAGPVHHRPLLEIDDTVDLVVVATPAEEVIDVVADAARRGARGVVVLSDGFGETGESGRRLERELVDSARGHGMRVIGPHCLGAVNTRIGLHATVAAPTPLRGVVGVYCQSSALGLAILEQAASRGLGVSTFVSAGNRADVSGNDLLQYWTDDEDTHVAALYLETFGNPRKFARVARHLSALKPVVVATSATAPPGLTDSRLGDRAVQALFEQSGVVRTRSLTEFLDATEFLATHPLPQGRRVAVIGASVALCALAADAFESAGLHVLPGWPVDESDADLAVRIRTAEANPDVDAVVVVGATGELAGGGGVKPVVHAGLSPEAAARALAAASSYAEWRARPTGSVPVLSTVDTERARHLISRALGSGVAVDAADLLGCYGIDVVPSTRCGDPDSAARAATDIGYPVALKVADGALRHRVDLGGVRLDLESADHVRSAYAAMTSLTDGDLLVQPMCPPGVACLVELAEDPAFGAIVGFGIAGVATELLHDMAWRAAPLTDVDAAELVRAPLASPLLFGYDGADQADVAALEDLLLRLGILADELPEVAAVTLRPVLAGVHGVHVLHAEVAVTAPARRPDYGPRRLR